MTIALCSWTSLCLNVPAERWKGKRYLCQKFLMMLLGILGPEFVLQLSCGQWFSARRSVKKFMDGKYTDWTMAHAFLADMGGFTVNIKAAEPNDGKAQVWPLDAEQVSTSVRVA